MKTKIQKKNWRE